MVKRLRLGPGAADESEAELFGVLDTIDERLSQRDQMIARRRLLQRRSLPPPVDIGITGQQLVRRTLDRSPIAALRCVAGRWRDGRRWIGCPRCVRSRRGVHRWDAAAGPLWPRRNILAAEDVEYDATHTW
jgi:hypothetical protein